MMKTKMVLASCIFFMLFAMIPIGMSEQTITKVFYATPDMVITDWPQFWTLFRQHAKWRLEVNTGTGWLEINGDLLVHKEYTEIHSQMQSCKITLIFDATYAGDYRLTFGIDKHARRYIHKESSWNYTLAYEGYAVNFDWSDIKEIPNLQVSHGIKEIGTEKWFWFRIRRDNVPKDYHIEIDPVLLAYSTASDGYIHHVNSNYATVRNSQTGTSISNTTTFLSIGQYQLVADYHISRGFVFFDTSSLAGDSIITSAILGLYGQADWSEIDFNITIQNGQPTYPRDPLELGDYARGNYSGNGGYFDTSGFSTSAYNNITLNSDGRSWITKGGTTKLCLRSSREIAGVVPSSENEEDVYVEPYEEGEGFRPFLEVTYSSPLPTDIDTSMGNITAIVASLLAVNGVILGIAFIFVFLGIMFAGNIAIEQATAIVIIPTITMLALGIMFLALTALGGL